MYFASWVIGAVGLFLAGKDSVKYPVYFFDPFGWGFYSPWYAFGAPYFGFGYGYGGYGGYYHRFGPGYQPPYRPGNQAMGSVGRAYSVRGGMGSFARGGGYGGRAGGFGGGFHGGFGGGGGGGGFHGGGGGHGR